jgi:hypothetical protein
MKHKLLLLAIIILGTLESFAQKKNKEKVGSYSQNTVLTTGPSDSLKIAQKLDSLNLQLKELIAKIMPPEDITPYKDSTKTLKENVKNLEGQISDLVTKNNEILEGLKKTKQEKDQYENAFNNQIKTFNSAYETIARNIISMGVYIPSSVLDSIALHLKNTNDITSFKTQSNDLKFVKELLINKNINSIDFNKAKEILKKPINPSFLGLSNEYKILKTDFDAFCMIAKNLSQLISENKNITDKEYRKGEFTITFAYYEACKLYPYLNDKVTQALTNPATKIDLDLP